MRGLLGSVFVLFLSLSVGEAQEFRATLSGVVRDQSGALVAKARVKATKKDSGQSYSAVTNAEGFYMIPYLIHLDMSHLRVSAGDAVATAMTCARDEPRDAGAS
jgi:hypothetical protein